MPSSRHPSSNSARGYWGQAATATIASWRDAVSSNVAKNIASGVTVALVALPLNMALALACGLPASVGLVTGAVAGVLGAFLGGPRFQITGPEVALAPITFEVVAKHGKLIDWKLVRHMWTSARLEEWPASHRPLGRT